VAAFPIFWITVISVKLPIDAFNSNPLNVIFGPVTLTQGKGLSFIDITVGLAIILFTAKLTTGWLGRMVNKYSPNGYLGFGWIIGSMAFGISFIVVFFAIMPSMLSVLNDYAGELGNNIIGFSTQHYSTVWFERDFINNFKNSLLVTTGVVTISLTFGTLAGYGLSRSGSNLAFWILIIALIFRALPHSVLVTGYLPFFINSAEILRPIFGDAAPTFMECLGQRSLYWLLLINPLQSGCCVHSSKVFHLNLMKLLEWMDAVIFKHLDESLCL